MYHSPAAPVNSKTRGPRDGQDEQDSQDFGLRFAELGPRCTRNCPAPQPRFSRQARQVRKDRQGDSLRSIEADRIFFADAVGSADHSQHSLSAGGGLACFARDRFRRLGPAVAPPGPPNLTGHKTDKMDRITGSTEAGTKIRHLAKTQSAPGLMLGRYTRKARDRRPGEGPSDMGGHVREPSTSLRPWRLCERQVSSD